MGLQADADRREFLRKAAIAGGIAWTAPMVITLDATPAYATPAPATLNANVSTVEEGSGTAITISGTGYVPNQAYEVRWRQPSGFEYVAFESLLADANGALNLATINVYADARTLNTSTAFIHTYDTFGTCIATKGLLVSAASFPPNLNIVGTVTTAGPNPKTFPIREGNAKWGKIHEQVTTGHVPDGWSPEKIAKIQEIVGAVQPVGYPKPVTHPATGTAMRYKKGSLVCDIDHTAFYPTPGGGLGQKTAIPDGMPRGFIHGPFLG